MIDFCIINSRQPIALAKKNNTAFPYGKDAFSDFVVTTAEKEGKVFILDSGEGNDYVDAITGWYVENLSGWLVNPSQKELLLTAKSSGTAHRDFSDFYVFARWSKTSNGNITVAFEKY